MKNFFLAAALLFTVVCSSQYSVQWQNVDSLELEGRVESAGEIVQNILSRAQRQKDFEQLIKAKIFRYKFYQVNNEESDQYILKDLNHTIAQLPVPWKNVLLSYKGRSLKQYYDEHRWRIRRRKAVDNPDPADLGTWAEATLQDSIRSSYKNSLQKPKILVSTPVDVLSELLEPEPLNRKYKPTLYDLLAYEAIEYFRNSSHFPPVRPEEEYAFNEPALFGTSDEFQKLQFPPAARNTSEVAVLKTFQQLEELHSAEKDTLALVYSGLKRLEYVRENYRGDENWEKYMNALDRLSQKYSNSTAAPLLLYTGALYYYERADERDEKGKLLHPSFNKKAVELAQQVVETYPGTEMEQRAFSLLSAIKSVHLQVRMPEYLLPKNAGRLLLSYKSIDSVQLKIFRVPAIFPNKFNWYQKKDEIQAFAEDHVPIHSQALILPRAEDYNSHSTEALIPPLETGTYMVYISGENSFEKKGYNFGFLKVTDLSLSQTAFEKSYIYRALNRTTGLPEEDVQLTWIYKGISGRQKSTNNKGELEVRKPRYNSNQDYIIASKGKDTLVTSYWESYYGDFDEDDENEAVKTLFYLDRAIYRPGQKVHFKGVLLSHRKGKTETVANEYVEIYVEDPNGEEVVTFRLKTNKYGSFHEEFLLPKNGITGSFSIYAEEDTESETPFWERVWDNDSYRESEQRFRVEEYKRPTFEVTIDSIKKSYSFEDSITVTGTARAFMGAPVSNARVIYTVNRREMVYRWWYYEGDDFTMIETDTIQTDEKGHFKLKFPAEVAAGDTQKKDLIYEYSVDAAVTDITGETREGNSILKIGKKNLLLKLELPQTISRGDTIHPRIMATNLNENPVPVKGSFKIYKLRGPDRVLRERLWPAPEVQTIPKEQFLKLFPEEPYEDVPEPQDWPLGEPVFEAEFETDGRYEPEVIVSPQWKTGKYVALVEAESEGNSTTSKRIFDVNDPAAPSLPDNQRFAASMVHKDPVKEKKIKLLLQTSYSDLYLHVGVYDGFDALYKEFLKVNRSRLLEIPLGKTSSKELQVQVTGIRKNSAFREILSVSIPQTKNSLLITTKTFRSKISPGMEETWSFQVRDSKKKVPDAEVLASMYDMSLDQFTTQDWITNAGFRQTYSYFPTYNFSNANGSIGLFNRFPSPWHYRPQTRRFDKLSLFGFLMSNPDSYMYRNYLRNKEIRDGSGNLTGNTRGKVTDNAGLPLPGVSVVIQGTEIGTMTDFDGMFALDTGPGDVLLFSYVGFMPEQVLVSKEEVYVTLTEDSNNLEEVVVTGYGMAVEEAEEDSRRMLQGKVAGIQVTAANTVQIRGMSSTAEGGMLYVVDGEVVTNYEMDKESILSVKILKPDEAMALYGAAAAGGAVVINTKKGLEDLQKVEARKDLDETAFFFPELRLEKDGKLEFSFTTPEALTQWKLRLLAHTGDWITGSYENTVRTQKKLNVMPNPPRFLRENDSIIFKAKISNLTPEALTGTAILELFDALTMEPLNKKLGNSENLKNFSISETGNTVVAWDLVIPQGVQAVTFRVLAKAGDFTDGEENFLPVLSNRMLVKESLPFFVRAGENESYVFENMKDNDSPSLEHHKYTLEYSSNPAWYALQSLPYLMEFEHECSEQTFARLYANAVGSHIVHSKPAIKEVFEAWKKDSSLVSALEKNEELKDLILAEAPWIRDAASETAQKQVMANLFDSERLGQEQKNNLKKLEQMQQSSGGWPWFSGGEANPFITRHILAGLGHLEKLGVEIEDSEMTKNAIAFLDRDILSKEAASSSKKDFYHSSYLLHYLYARTFFLDEIPPSEEVELLMKRAVDAGKKDWLEKGLYDQGLLMLILNRSGENEFAKNIALALKEQAVKSDDYGMYWKENERGWYWYRAPVETQALLIEAFTELKDTAAVEEMKIWLLQNKRTNHWSTTKATTEASYALLMQGEDWLQTGDKTVLKLGGKPIAEEKFAGTSKEAGTGYQKLVWQAEEITDDFSKITVENNNTTAGYGGAYWQYFEDLDKIKDHGSSPLNVEKELYLNIPDNEGSSLKKISSETSLELGDLVTVRLVVRSTADMEFIHLKDMRASGFEPVNVLSQYKYRDGAVYYESTRDAATHFFFDELRKGTYVLEYAVRANNAGKFSNGITTIESMYAPEFSGHTKGIRVEIK